MQQDQTNILQQFLQINQFPKTYEEAKNNEFKFWNTQPVPKINEIISGSEGPIDFDKTSEKASSENFALPDDFEWINIDMKNDVDSQKVSDFLNYNYLEDKNGNFRLHYSKDFLKWFIIGPNYQNDLCIGVQVKKSKILVGFIAGILTNLQLNQNEIKLAEIDFLCVHPKLRGKRLSVVLIKEISRRIQLKDYSHAIYTSERYLPKPFSESQFYHRALNITPLVETGFLTLNDINIRKVKKSLQLPIIPLNKNFVEIQPKYMEGAFNCLINYLQKFNCYPKFSMAEFEHTFLNKNFVTCYVLIDNNDKVLDMISYYILPTKVANNKKYEFIKAAYLFYYSSINETTYRLIKDIMIIAKNKGMDVFNALDIMENSPILKELNFELGTGKLHYYFYNWKCHTLKNHQLAKILL
ncbi:Myristoyl-CoA:protein N-myristoyltransferase [uncultured virus]|nr:Myristoyl-CoA:protein N-myristoyltransferase [uncultured virus]